MRTHSVRAFDCDRLVTSKSQASEPGVDDWNLHWGCFGEATKENPANRYRQHLIFKLLGPLPEGAHVLDVGSGQGELDLSLKRKYLAAPVLGLEDSAEGVRRSMAIARESRLDVRFSQRDLLAPSPLSSTDQHWATHAVCSEVLEHLDQPVLLLEHALRYLAPNCQLIVTVAGGPRSAFDRHIGHCQHSSPTQLCDLLERAGYDVVQVLRAGFPFFELDGSEVIVRGQRLIKESTPRGGEVGGSAAIGATLRIFHLLFHANLPLTPWGWQIWAEAPPRPRDGQMAE